MVTFLLHLSHFFPPLPLDVPVAGCATCCCFCHCLSPSSGRQHHLAATVFSPTTIAPPTAATPLFCFPYYPAACCCLPPAKPPHSTSSGLAGQLHHLASPLVKSTTKTPYFKHRSREITLTWSWISLSFWVCFSYDYWLFDQDKCTYIIFITFGDVINFRFECELDHVSLMQKRISLSLFKLLLCLSVIMLIWC